MAVELSDLEKTCREIGQLIGRGVEDSHGKEKVGFCLLLFDFGEGGNCTYVSNADRADMRAALREFYEWLGEG